MEYQKVCLENYDRSKGGRPIVNSIAASRENLDEMIELVGEYDALVIVMVSEKFTDEGSAQCMDPRDSLGATKEFVELLTTKANRTLDHILVDPGLAPVGADTYGLVNIGLDAMRLIHEDPDLKGIHMHVGLTNFAWGTPMSIRPELEKAYLTLAMPYGLDYALANPEIDPRPLPEDDPLVEQLREALERGRAEEGESQEMAGFRQAEAIMEICRAAEPADD
jgi:5-methyltetrahydrofolate--homocysteine methyltransferase